MSLLGISRASASTIQRLPSQSAGAVITISFAFTIFCLRIRGFRATVVVISSGAAKRPAARQELKVVLLFSVSLHLGKLKVIVLHRPKIRRSSLFSESWGRWQSSTIMA